MEPFWNQDKPIWNSKIFFTEDSSAEFLLEGSRGSIQDSLIRPDFKIGHQNEDQGYSLDTLQKDSNL